ncbi:MAG: F0F1 ATP synthase subunit alpha [Patescibacteria group bacterium]
MDNKLVESVKILLSKDSKNLRESNISGEVVSTKDGVAEIVGIEQVVGMNEVVEFVNQISGKISKGLVLNIEEFSVKALILGDDRDVEVGTEVFATGKTLSINVSESILGRVINSIGEPLDGNPKIFDGKECLLEKKAPGVVFRKSVDTPLQTGISAIDALIPIGRGQRELIIGDRQTGKTSIALDTIINQKDSGVKCIYVAIGQKASKVAQIVEFLKSKKAFENTVVVSANASDPAVLQYLAPYAGCAIGEYFMEKGQDALVVFDDLSKHAQSYRQISLLLRRPPGREAYPGDVFYLHSRLLERSARLSDNKGGGSLTALPIIETQAGDVSAYIPTNVISITDGQIYLESALFYSGQRPAVNVGLSVSRVGSAAQTKIIKKIAGKLKLELAQFRELEAFAQFGSQDLDESTKQKIEKGRVLMEILKQKNGEPRALWQHSILIYAGTNGYFNKIPQLQVSEKVKELISFIETGFGDLVEKIETEKALTEEIEMKIKNVLAKFFE